MNQATFTVKCSAFANNDYIPSRFSCEGQNINPELVIEHLPENTRSLALVLEDPDPAFGTFDHWVVWNIPPVGKIGENSIPGVTGKNSRNENKYTGPCPPSGVHKYHFKLYALDDLLHLPESAGKKELLAAMEGHILAASETVGLFYK